MLFFFKDFKVMLLLFALLGFATTFSSGSKDAWIVDMINRNNKKLTHRFFGKMQFFINFGLVISGIIGAFFVKNYGLSIIWLATFSSYVLSITILYFFAKEDYLRKNVGLSKSFSRLKTQSKQALSYSYKHHVLFYLIFAGMIATFALGLQESIAWVPLLRSLGMQEYQFGYLWSAMTLIAGIAPIFAVKFLKKGKEKNLIVAGLILFALVTAGILFAYNLIIALIIMFLGILFYFAKSPSEEVYFHRFIPSKLRATIGSIKNMTFALATLIILPIEGFLVDNIGAKYTIFISTIPMVLAVILYLKIKEK